MSRSSRKHTVVGHADPNHHAQRGEFSGVAVAASYTLNPVRSRPVAVYGYKVGEPDRRVEVRLTTREAEKVARDILSFLGYTTAATDA